MGTIFSVKHSSVFLNILLQGGSPLVVQVAVTFVLVRISLGTWWQCVVLSGHISKLYVSSLGRIFKGDMAQ